MSKTDLSILQYASLRIEVTLPQEERQRRTATAFRCIQIETVFSQAAIGILWQYPRTHSDCVTALDHVVVHKKRKSVERHIRIVETTIVRRLRQRPTRLWAYQKFFQGSGVISFGARKSCRNVPARAFSRVSKTLIGAAKRQIVAGNRPMTSSNVVSLSLL